MDYSFLKLYNSIEESINDNDFKSSNLWYFNMIQLSPSETYSQKTNFSSGISFDSDINCYIVDLNDNILKDITNNVFTDEFVDSNGNNQVKIEIVNINEDFYYQNVSLRIDVVSSNAKYYTRPIYVSNKNIDRTYRFDYKGLSNMDGLSYANSDFTQSIRLRLDLSSLNNNSEIGEYYQISNGNTVSTRPLKKLSKTFTLSNIDSFTFLRFQELLLHDIIYIDGIRVSNKPLLEPGENIGRSNLFKASFNAFLNDKEQYSYTYQIYNGLVYDSFFPSGNYITGTSFSAFDIVFSEEILLNTGSIYVYDSDGNLVISFDQSNMSVTLGNVLKTTVTSTIMENPSNGSYYVHVDEGLVTGILGETNEAINDNSTWNFTLRDADYDNADYNNEDYYTN
tara:strand:+ start:1583 stop:2767 length:1185 start_codon:yes stop_codon:yes gene_type:complete